MLLHIAVRLLCRDNYLTAKTDRFLVGFKKSILTPQGGLGGCRGVSGPREFPKESSEISIQEHKFLVPVSKVSFWDPGIGEFLKE